jgi:hypothetical protein
MSQEQYNENNQKTGLSPEELNLLKKNLEVSEAVLEKINSIKKYIKLQQVWATVRLLIIVIPLIIGFFYLPNFLERYFDKMF